MNSQRKISVVIPTFNGGARLGECLAAIRRQKTDAEIDLLAFDSGSTDDTIDTLEKFGARIIRIPNNEFNHGATRNRAIEAAEGAIVVLTVQDALPQGEGWLEALTAPFADPLVAGTYGRQIARDDADLMTKKRLSEWTAARTERITSEIAGGEEYEKLAPIEKYRLCAFDNVCSCVRKSVWEKHKFPRTNFAEDIEWARDVLLDGYRIVYEPAAAVLHSHRRPVLYEYRRTCIAARRLYRVFGYASVRSFSELLHHSFYYIKNSARMVWRSNLGAGEKMRNLYRALTLGFLETFAQYRAYRHESKGRPLEKMRGV